MNKVYFFSEVSEEYGGVHVAAQSWKAAREIALTDELISEHIDNPITDVKGSLCRHDKKPITTEIEGKLTTQQICDLGLAWWDCEECGDDNFEIFNHESEYRCRSCGFVENVPYVGL